MNSKQNTLGQILAAKSVVIQTDYRVYSADQGEFHCVSSPVFWHLGQEILDAEFQAVYGAST